MIGRTKRLIVILLAIILTFSGMCQMALADDQQLGETEGTTLAVKDFSQFLTGFRFYNATSNEDYGPNNLVKNGDAVAIRYSFVLPNQQDFVAGEVYELPALPAVFNLDGIADKEEPIHPGSPVYWKVTADRRIEVRFTEDMKGSNISGFMEITCTAEVTDPSIETIVFDLGQFEAATDSFDTENKPGPKPEVEKSGVLSEDGTITWTITATPDTTKENSTLTGYILTDTFTDKNKHTYVENSLKLDGVAVAHGQLTDSGFSYVFEEGISGGSHQLTFQTKVNQDLWYTGGKTVVKNTATLQMPDGEETVKSDAEVLVKELKVNKKKDNKNGNLNYTKNEDGSVDIYFAVDVEYKKEAGRYNKVQIKDRIVSQIPEDRIGYVPDSILVKYDGQEEAVKPTYTLENGNLIVDLDNNKDKATLYYTIRVASLNGLGGYTGFNFKNYADLILDGNSPSVSDWEDTTIGLGADDPTIYLRKSGNLAESVDGENLINWTININDAQKDFKDKPLYIIDTLKTQSQQGAHDYSDGSLRVTFDGKDVTNDTTKVDFTYKAGQSGQDPQLKLTLKNVGNAKIVITYKSKITKMEITPKTGSIPYRNIAVLKTEGYKDQEVEATVNLSPNVKLQKEGKYNWAKSVYGDKGVFDWDISFGRDKLSLHRVVVTDTLPEGHKLAGAVKVNDVEIGKEANGDNPYYTVEDGKVKVHFPGAVKGRTKITLTTEAPLAEGTKILKAENNVSITSEEISEQLTAKKEVTVNFMPELDKTTDYKIGDKVNWKISLNKNGAIIAKQKATLKDALPPGLVYQEGSAKLISSDGNEIAGLTVTYDEETKLLSIQLPDGLDLTKAYQVKFTTDVVTYIKDIKNTISFDGSAEEVLATSGSVNLIANGTSSGIESDNIKLTLKKYDQDGKPLKGAEFALYDKENREIGKMTTNEKGIAIFDIGLKYERNFTVKEIKAPDGYVAEVDGHTVAIGEKEEDGTKVLIDDIEKLFKRDGNGTLQIDMEVVNTMTEASFTKAQIHNGETQPLSGAAMEIRGTGEDADTVIASWTSGNEPYVVKGVLETGKDYVLKETRAPEGFLLADDIHFTINPKGKAEIIRGGTLDDDGNIQMIDRRKSGSIQIEKRVFHQDMQVYSQETFYVGLFADKELTKRIGDIKAMKLEGLEPGMALFEELKPGTYYLAETDENGNVIGPENYRDFGYTPVFDQSVATLVGGETIQIQLTNKVYSETGGESDDPGNNETGPDNGNTPGDDTPENSPGEPDNGDTPKDGNPPTAGDSGNSDNGDDKTADPADTGDKGQLALWVMLLVTSLGAGTTFTAYRRKKNY